MSSFWSGWIIVLTAITIIGATWLLLGNRKSTRGEGKTTGHTHDGIEEYDNPLPAWWLYMFLASIVFAIGYLLLFPGLGNFPGLLDWTQEKRYESEVARAEARYAPLFNAFLERDVESVARDTQALKMGQRLFANYCAQCHGSDARGSHGFPNLADNDWLWGGDPASIKQSITQGRQAAMPAWGPMLNDTQLNAVVAHVQHLAGEGPASKAGATVYETYCTACHGPQGRGNPMFGAPDLTDDTWLYGGDEQAIRRSIANGRNGQMPAHTDLLDEARIHLLTAYVYSLSHNGP